MKIAYTGAHFPEGIQQSMRDCIAEHGYTLDIVKPDSRDAWDTRERLRGYDVIICSGESYRGETIEYLSDSLRLLSRHGIGTDEIDKARATALGIAVCNAAGTLSKCVAECALALILNVLHGYAALDADTRVGRWAGGTFSHELWGMTVGLLGFGGIARELAKLVGAFGCGIIACDPFWNESEAIRLNVRRAAFDEVFAESDIVSIHTPLTDETRGMVDMARLKTMKKSAILINTSRGAIVNEADLVTALECGIISGAGLDVFEREPLPSDSPLIALKNTMLLPHIASHTYESQLAAGLTACRNALAFLSGKAPGSLLNPEYINHVR